MSDIDEPPLSLIPRSKEARLSRSIPSSISSGSGGLVASFFLGGDGLRDGGELPRRNKLAKACLVWCLRGLELLFADSFDRSRPRNKPWDE